jgi:drug/metabolite transporter, DME family
MIPASSTDRPGITLVIAAATLWATVGVSTKLVPGAQSLAPELLGFARMAIAGPVLLCAAWILKSGRGLRLPRFHPASLLVFSLSCIVFQLALFRSFAEVGVTITVFLTVCLPPVLAFVWTLLFGRVRVTPAAISALALALAGLGAFSLGDGSGESVLRSNAWYLVFPVCASVAFVTMSFAARSLALSATPLEVAGVGLMLSALLLVPALPWLLPLTGAGLSTWRVADGDLVLLLLYLGLGPTALAYFCYCSGMARCRNAISGFIATMIEPMVAALLALVLLGENLAAPEMAACVLLLMSMGVLWQVERGPVNDARRQPAE